MAIMYTDEKLIVDCLKGRRAAQKLLYDRYATKMFWVCIRYTKNRADAEDVLQDGFVKVFTKLDMYKNTGSFEGWMRRIMINTALLHRRNDKLSQYFVDTDISEASNISEELECGDDSSIYAGINSDELLNMVQALPEGYRLVFSLYAIDGYNHKEIGNLLNISEGTSKSQLSRARGLLKKMLEKNYSQITMS